MYKDVARFVGLEAPRRMHDIGTFELRRSRIPTSLFKSIAQDMDMAMTQYGPVSDLEHEEAIFQFVSPVRTISLFETVNEPWVSFPTDLSPSCVRVQLSFQVHTRVHNQGLHLGERPDTVLLYGLWGCRRSYRGDEAERNRTLGCNRSDNSGKSRSVPPYDVKFCEYLECAETVCGGINSRRNLDLPLYSILCDGVSFQFFAFDRSTKPRSFFRGIFPGDPPSLRKGLKLPDIRSSDTTLPFLRYLRIVCETVFDVLQRAYISSVTAFRNQTMNQEGGLNKWDDAILLAGEALEKFRTAEKRRQTEERARANELVAEALSTLRNRSDYFRFRLPCDH
jgi:hypothetical protein